MIPWHFFPLDLPFFSLVLISDKKKILKVFFCNQIYSKCFPTGNANEFCDHVFRTFDSDKNGFIDFYDLFSDEESEQHGVFSFEFTEEDIKRSEILKFIVRKIKDINNQEEVRKRNIPEERFL